MALKERSCFSFLWWSLLCCGQNIKGESWTEMYSKPQGAHYYTGTVNIFQMLQIGNILNIFSPFCWMCCSVHPAHIQGESCQLPSGQVPSVGPAGQDGACSSILGTRAAAKVGMSKIAVGSRLTWGCIWGQISAHCVLWEEWKIHPGWQWVWVLVMIPQSKNLTVFYSY